jgi:hypothetical protein
MRMPKAERELHRKTARQTFNKAWNYLDMKDRRPEDDIQMLSLAHASRYHWGMVGTPENQAVGDWQISRIYAALGQSDLALSFAKSALATCKKNGLQETELSAFEGIARAYALGRNVKTARRFLARARSLLDGLNLDKEDREIYLGQIEDTQRLIDRLRPG